MEGSRRSWKVLEASSPKQQLRHLFSSLQECRSEDALRAAQSLHLLLCSLGLDAQESFGSSLTSAFARCGHVPFALQLFSRLDRRRSEPLWTSLLRSLVEREAFQDAFRVYRQMRREKVRCSRYTLVPLLAACSRLGSVEEGLRIHGEILEHGFEEDEFLRNGLFSMYSRCGFLHESEKLLWSSVHLEGLDVVSWTSLLVGYVEMGLHEKALNCLVRMQQEGPTPDSITCISGWKACGDVKALSIGQQLHAFSFMVGMKMDVVQGNALVDMYAKCGFLEEAEHVFENLQIRDVVTWTALSGGYVDRGAADRALRCMEQMEIEGIAHDDVLFVLALKACSNVEGAISKGYCVHAKVIKQGSEAFPFVGSALLSLYCKCNLVIEAEEVLNSLAVRDTVSWNAMMSGYIEVGFSEEVLRCFQEMQWEGIPQDQVTFLSGLKASGDVGELELGKTIHIHITKTGLENDIMSGNVLVYMYVKCGSFLDAWEVFEKLPVKDAASWTSLIEGYADYGCYEEALNLFDKMQLEGIPIDEVSFHFSLQLLGGMETLYVGKKMHMDIVKKGFDHYSFLGIALIEMYARSGLVIDAQQVLGNGPFLDVVAWNAVLKGFMEQGFYEKAINCFRQMELENVSPDALSYTVVLKSLANLKETSDGPSLHADIMKKGLEKNHDVADAFLEMYANCWSKETAVEILFKIPVTDLVSWNLFIGKLCEGGQLEKALDILLQMQSKGFSPGKVAWAGLISAYVEQGETEQALLSYRQMQEQGLMPDDAIFLSIGKCCGNESMLEIGKQTHAQVIARSEVIGLDLATCYIDMYGKCGSIGNAQEFFDMIPTHDIMSWDALIRGYVFQGESAVVFHLLDRLVQTSLQPDSVIFLAVLTLCMHAGISEEARCYFEVMQKRYGVTPGIKHFACMMDLLGRGGQINEAIRVIGMMPFQPNIVMWHSILGACQRLCNVELGKWAFQHALQLDRRHAVSFILMCNIYIDALMWTEVEEIEPMRNEASEGFYV